MELPSPTPESQPVTPAPAVTSLPARLMNVFASPGEVFDEVKAVRASAANWLVPALTASLVGVVASFIMFSQPAIVQQIQEQQERAMRQKFDQQVAAGKMTQAQEDQMVEMMEKYTGPTMMKIFGAVGSVLTSFARVFWWGLILWLLGRWMLKKEFGYLKAAEVAGLASMIAVLGGIVALLMIVNFGKLSATPSLAFTVSDFDLKRRSHLLLGAANLFTFWQVTVMAIGLARLASVPFARALLPVLGFWIVWTVLLVLSGLGQFAL
jgi:hypothetical protein